MSEPKQLAKVDKVVEYLDTNNRRVKLSIQIVRQFFCPTASDAEAIAFIQHCRLLGANPWLRQIYLIKYDPKAPAQIVISRDFFLRLVSSMPNYRGIRSGIVVYKKKPLQNEVAETVAHAIENILKNYELDENLQNELLKIQLYCQKHAVAYEPELLEIEGTIIPPGYELVGGWCEILLKNPEDPSQPIRIRDRVALAEYNKNQALWKTMPATMIQVCAERRVARKAFSEVLGGVYGAEELGIPTTPEGEPLPAPEVSELPVMEVSDEETPPTNDAS